MTRYLPLALLMMCVIAGCGGTTKPPELNIPADAVTTGDEESGYLTSYGNTSKAVFRNNVFVSGIDLKNECEGYPPRSLVWHVVYDPYPMPPDSEGCLPAYNEDGNWYCDQWATEIDSSKRLHGTPTREQIAFVSYELPDEWEQVPRPQWERSAYGRMVDAESASKGGGE